MDNHIKRDGVRLRIVPARPSRNPTDRASRRPPRYSIAGSQSHQVPR